MSSIDAAIETICRSPQKYSALHESYRRSLVRRFPYAIYYEDAEGTVIVYGVFHTSRDPGKWRLRLP